MSTRIQWFGDVDGDLWAGLCVKELEIEDNHGGLDEAESGPVESLAGMIICGEGDRVGLYA